MMKIMIDTGEEFICSKRQNLIDGIVGIAMGMGYCPKIFGWKTNPSLTQENCEGDDCIKCWNYAKRKALVEKAEEAE